MQIMAFGLESQFLQPGVIQVNSSFIEDGRVVDMSNQLYECTSQVKSRLSNSRTIELPP